MRKISLLFILFITLQSAVIAQDFNFVVLPDRTGGFRDGVYENAIEKINLLQPDFVIGIGDYVEGYTDDTIKIKKQWDEFLQITSKLKVPFYKVAGNHDYTGEAQKLYWKKNFGNAYQHFVFNNCLFLLINSNDGDGVAVSKEQLDYFKKIIKQYTDVEWTFVLLHHPLWNYNDDKGFREIESLLAKRSYTVFAGHTHVYNHQQRNEKDYITVATAGGSSKLRGDAFGELDHISLINFKNKKTSIAQLKLDGILQKDFTNRESVVGARKLDAMLHTNVTVLEKNNKGIFIFNLENKSNQPVKYEIDFFNNPALHIAEDRMVIDVQPNTVHHQKANVEKNQSKPSNLRYMISVSSLMPNGDSLYLNKISSLPFIANQPMISLDTVHYFTDLYSFSEPRATNGFAYEYSIDNDKNFRPFKNSITFDKTSSLNIRLKDEATNAVSLPQTFYFNKLEFLKPINVNKNKLREGLHFRYYEGEFSKVPDFSKLKVLKQGVINSFRVEEVMQRSNNFAILYTGYVEIPKDGLYKINLHSDDGSKLYLHDECIVDNDGSHSARTRSGYAALKKGLHPITVEYFEDFDGEILEVHFMDEQNNIVPVKYFTDAK